MTLFNATAGCNCTNARARGCGVKQEPLTRTLVLQIALPDVWVEDVTQEAADEFFSGDLGEAAYHSLSLTSSSVRVVLETGDKGGTDTHDVEGQILSAKVVPSRE